MVQFLSINFFFYFFIFCWVFQNFPFFCVSLYDPVWSRNFLGFVEPKVHYCVHNSMQLLVFIKLENGMEKIS